MRVIIAPHVNIWSVFNTRPCGVSGRAHWPIKKHPPAPQFSSSIGSPSYTPRISVHGKRFPIYGNPKRGTGILHNELYIGRLVWNKLRYLKAPDTGKRVSRPNPESEWVISQVPALRIVDDELWQSVQARYATVQKKWGTAEPGKRFRQFVRPKYLFTGMTKCGECGAGFVVYYRDRLGGFGTRERGTCTNTLTIPRQEVEARVLTALQEKLLRKDFFEEFCREFTKEMNRMRMEQRAGLTSAKREVERIGRRIKKLLDLMLDDQIAVAEAKTEMRALDERR